MDLDAIIEYKREHGLVNETDDDDDFIRDNPHVAIPYLIMICLAMTAGTVGNFFIIGAVLVERSLRTNGNVFIVNLAIADLCVSAFVNPFGILGIVVGESWFDRNSALCTAIASICLTSCYCSLHSIGAISFNRYVHICHYQAYNRIFTLRNSVLMAVGLWIVSFLMEMPNFLGWGNHYYDKKSLNCMWNRTHDYGYNIFFATAGIGFPIGMISYCHYKVYSYVRRSERRVASVNQETVRKTAAQFERSVSMRLSKTLTIIFVIFCVCWSPYAFTVVIDRHDNIPLGVYIFVVLVAHTNSSINCILYGMTNKEFRRGYWKVVNYTKCGRMITGKFRKKQMKSTLNDVITINCNTDNITTVKNIEQ